MSDTPRGRRKDSVPTYLAKVTTANGLVKPPMVVSCASEEEAMGILRSHVDADDVVELRGPLPFAMKAAFAHVPEGSAVFRYDWIWPADGGEPKPY